MPTSKVLLSCIARSRFDSIYNVARCRCFAILYQYQNTIGYQQKKTQKKIIFNRFATNIFLEGTKTLRHKFENKSKKYRIKTSKLCSNPFYIKCDELHLKICFWNTRMRRRIQCIHWNCCRITTLYGIVGIPKGKRSDEKKAICQHTKIAFTSQRRYEGVLMVEWNLP